MPPTEPNADFSPEPNFRKSRHSIFTTHLPYMYPGSTSYDTPQNINIYPLHTLIMAHHIHHLSQPFISPSLQCLAMVYIQMPSHNSPLPVHTHFSLQGLLYRSRSKSNPQMRTKSRDEGLQTLRVVTCNSECKAQKIMIF